jgi:FkbM family methyltransferase
LNLSCPTRFFGELFALTAMLNPFKYFAMPEYFFNPRHAFRRFRRLWHTEQPREIVRLPWGATLLVHTTESIGHHLYYYGIFDKVVPEAIERLLDPGEVAVEIGANIGQSCSLMARKVGPSGRVLAFEPHPEIVEELRENAARWNRSRYAAAQIEPVALGPVAGEAFLEMGPGFATNRGSATLRTNGRPVSETVKISMARLDDFLHDIRSVSVCKIDVEGHELDVLKGATQALERRMIRDIIFEDFSARPSPVTALLRHYGYEVFRLNGNWIKPRLSEAEAEQSNPPSDNYLATLDPTRTHARFRPLGWRCLMYF